MWEGWHTEVCMWLNFGCYMEHKGAISLSTSAWCSWFPFQVQLQKQRGCSQKDHAPCCNPVFENWTETGSPALYSQQFSSPTQICSPGYASVSLKEKTQHNRMSKILCKTLWSLFYPNYNNVILNHMARVMWCKDFPTFLTFSHPKRVWKDKAVISF